MINLSTRQQVMVGLFLAALMAVTRGHHIATIENLPSAAWAVFFLAGIYLRSIWLLPALLLEAAALDYAAVTWGGVSSFCISPAYAFLLPAYGSLWLAGQCYAKHYRFEWRTLPRLLISSTSGVLVCQLFSSGGFYFYSGRFTDPSLSEFTARLLKYTPHTLETMAFYVAFALVVHSLFVLLDETSRLHNKLVN
ncbi:MAG: hypothetical protein JKX87_01600 [Cycloclasticus sp.]|nr:hypothetical protein [Cycloclasticus sp.]